jgi:dTDP-4-dehydrorhamnose reductase
MKVAVIGASGQLGKDIVAAFAGCGEDVHPITHSDMELTSPESVSKRLKELKPQLVVNTAAMHHVERCEQDPERAFAVNALGSRNLAQVTCELDATIIHVSTDYVFDGCKQHPYVEQDPPQPLNVYGNTKLSGEYFIRSTNPKHFVVRTSGLYGKNPCRGKGGLNFVDLMIKLGKERGRVRVVNNEEITPTPTAELAQQILLLASTGRFGLYHATSEGSCTWYDFAKEIFAVACLDVKTEIADPTEFPSKVPRPTYSVLENAALKRHDMNCLRPWQEGLRCYLSEAVPASLQVV